jgi:hypothetical protein
MDHFLPESSRKALCLQASDLPIACQTEPASAATGSLAGMRKRAKVQYFRYSISGCKSHGGGLFRLLEPEIRI